MRQREHRVRIKRRLVQTERSQDQVLHRLAIRLAGDDLDDAPGDDKP
jgi:hypothetical protein